MKIFLYLIFLIGLGCFFVLPEFQPIRSEVALIGKNISRCFQNLKDKTLEKTNWRLKEVAVIGTHYTKKSQWKKALDLTENQSMATVDLDALRTHFMALPWVKSVVVSRYLPDTLVIDVQEKTPIALWQNQGQYRALDEKANIIEDSTFTSNELLLVVGPDAPENTLNLLNSLNKVPKILQQVQSAVRVEGRRWNLYTSDKVKILLPQSEMDQALQRLNRGNTLEDLLKKNVLSIDMRVKGKIKLTLNHSKKSPQKKGKK